MKQKIYQLSKAVFDDISEIASLIDARGWAEKNAGNISIDLTDTLSIKPDIEEWIDLSKNYPELANCYFYITATGSRMRHIAKAPLNHALIIHINDKGTAYSVVYRGENCRPTSELPSHLGIHQLMKQKGSDSKVVLHAHATELIALTQYADLKTSEAINQVIWNMHPETIMFVPKGVGFVPYTLPGTEDIAQATLQQLKKHDIVLWEKHGVFAVGENLQDTFDSIDIVCKSAKIWLMCRSAGFSPEGFSQEQLTELRTLSENF